MTERCIPVSAVPAALGPEELRLKLAHLRRVLEQAAKPGIFLVQEGALRWLTGMRHQVIEVAPDAPSPVCALIMTRGSALELTFVGSFTELPRLRARLSEALADGPDLRLEVRERLPTLPEGCLAPGQADYAQVVGEVVRPLLGGLEGGQFRKLEWLHAHTHAALAGTAQAIEPGLDGEEVQALLRRELARRRIECNLVLVAVKGQEGHLHPLYDRGFRIERGCEVKLVTGTRFAELIVSASVMVRFGTPPRKSTGTGPTGPCSRGPSSTRTAIAPGPWRGRFTARSAGASPAWKISLPFRASPAPLISTTWADPPAPWATGTT